MGSIKMTALAEKIAIKFDLSAEDVAALAEAGFTTPRLIKDADVEELPEGLAEQLTRWFPQ